jgi:hypothetical protein
MWNTIPTAEKMFIVKNKYDAIYCEVLPENKRPWSVIS